MTDGVICFSQWPGGPWGRLKGWFVVSSSVSTPVPGGGSFHTCWMKSPQSPLYATLNGHLAVKVQHFFTLTAGAPTVSLDFTFFILFSKLSN